MPSVGAITVSAATRRSSSRAEACGQLETGPAGARSGQRIEARLRHAQPFDGLAVRELVRLVGCPWDGGLLQETGVRVEGLLRPGRLPLLLLEISGRADPLLGELRGGRASLEGGLGQLRALEDDERRSLRDALPLASRNRGDGRRFGSAQLAPGGRLERAVGEDRHDEVLARRASGRDRHAARTAERHDRQNHGKQDGRDGGPAPRNPEFGEAPSVTSFAAGRTRRTARSRRLISFPERRRIRISSSTSALPS